MNKFLISLLYVSFFASFTLDAAAYKGQSVFVKKCAICHKNGQVFVATKTRKEWTNITKNKSEKLAEIHLKSKNPDAKPSYEYFESGDFLKAEGHLKDFLIEYAGDSGNVPACN